MAVIEQKEVVNIAQIGKKGKISNKGILSFLENIGCKHSDIAGYGFYDIPNTHLSWVLLHWKVKVIKRPSYGDTVICKTWARIGNKISTLRDFEMYDENNHLLCIASSKWALLNTETGGIAKITDEILEKYQKEEKSVFGTEEILKLKEPEGTFAPSFTFSVLRRDIDFNQHMHNIFYLDYAYEALPQEVYNTLEKDHFEIMYKAGAKLGDKIDCYYTSVNNEIFVVMKNHETQHLHSIIKLS